MLLARSYTASLAAGAAEAPRSEHDNVPPRRFAVATEADLLTCPSCRAEVPLLDLRGARCLYCFKGIPVPAHAHEPNDSHTRLRETLHSDLAEVRGQRGGASSLWTFALASIVFTGVLGALLVYGVSYLKYVPDGLLILGGLICGGALFAASLSLFVRRLWWLASIPTARLTATDSLDAVCRSCAHPLSTGHTVARCEFCGTENLMPAPLIPKGHRQRYVEVAGRRLKTDSANTARAIARTHGEELVGWLAVALAATCAIGWAVWAQLPLAPSFFGDPVARIGIPVFLSIVFSGFGLYTVTSARRLRLRLADRSRRR